METLDPEAALETLYASSVEEHLAELAHHFERSANLDKAIDYLSRAAQRASIGGRSRLRPSQHGGRVRAIAADAAKTADATAVIDGAINELGRIDILVNNAGDAWLGHTLNTTDEEWLYCLEVNLMSAVRFTRGVTPHMRKQGGGRIINMSTVSAHTPLQTMHDYSSAKAGMLSFSKAATFELAPDKILVNCVCPAFIHSPMWEKLADSAIGAFGTNREEVYQNLTNQFVPLKRFGLAPGSVWTSGVSCFRTKLLHYRQSLRRGRRHDQIDLR